MKIIAYRGHPVKAFRRRISFLFSLTFGAGHGICACPSVRQYDDLAVCHHCPLEASLRRSRQAPHLPINLPVDISLGGNARESAPYGVSSLPTPLPNPPNRGAMRGTRLGRLLRGNESILPSAAWQICDTRHTSYAQAVGKGVHNLPRASGGVRSVLSASTHFIGQGGLALRRNGRRERSRGHTEKTGIGGKALL